MKTKKSCEDCKALTGEDTCNFKCALGFEIITDGIWVAHNPRPARKCPKPLTDEKLASLISKK